MVEQVGQFYFLIRKRIQLRPEDALFFFVNNVRRIVARLRFSYRLTLFRWFPTRRWPWELFTTNTFVLLDLKMKTFDWLTRSLISGWRRQVLVCRLQRWKCVRMNINIVQRERFAILLVSRLDVNKWKCDVCSSPICTLTELIVYLFSARSHCQYWTYLFSILE